MDSLLAEYERLGRPLDSCDLNPDTIVEFVGQHFASGAAASSFADPPRPPASGNSHPGAGMPASSMGMGAPNAEAAEQMAVFYVVNNANPQGEWQLHAFSAGDGQLVHSVSLPHPGVAGYYSLVFSGGEFAVAMSGQQPVPCQDLLVGFESEGSLAPPAGVAAHSTMLPGMTPHGTAPGGVREWQWQWRRFQLLCESWMIINIHGLEFLRSRGSRLTQVRLTKYYIVISYMSLLTVTGGFLLWLKVEWWLLKMELTMLFRLLMKPRTWIQDWVCV